VQVKQTNKPLVLITAGAEKVEPGKHWCKLVLKRLVYFLFFSAKKNSKRQFLTYLKGTHWNTCSTGTVLPGRGSQKFYMTDRKKPIK
jgi:hypothetical protein